MANILQQVGCRYVTKFYTNSKDGTPAWEEGVIYEALTCVSYKYGAYVSKIPVPADAGNPADNPTYWAEFPNPAMGAWEELRVRLNNEIEDRENADAELLEKLNAEITRATAAETQLSDDLTTETNARISADNTINQKLTEEINNRIDGDTNLQNDYTAKINAEASARINADTTLQSNIDAVASDLATEITNRANADTTLQSNIDTEATNRANADTTLQNSITSLQSYLSKALTAIVDKFYGGGTIASDGSITWGDSGTAAVGNMNVYGNSGATKYIRTHSGNSEDDVRVN